MSHAVLLWFGDILSIYAAVSMIVLVAVLLGPWWEKAALIAGLAWTYFLMLVFLVAMLLFGPMIQAMTQKEPKEKLPEDGPPVSLVSSDLPMNERFEAYFTPENSVRVYRHGTFLDQAGHRAVMHFASFLVGIPLATGWYLGACFLIGVQLIRVGAFEAWTRPPWVFPLFLSLGAGIGLPLHAASVTWGLLDPRSPWPGLLHLAGALPQALMYIALLTLWNESAFLPGLQERFRAVGRMALTNYLMQTVIAVTVFNNFGLGLYGYTGLLGGLVVVIGVWALELLWSPVWLHYFRMGPVEWAWRSAVQMRVLPLLVKREAPPVPGTEVQP